MSKRVLEAVDKDDIGSIVTKQIVKRRKTLPLFIECRKTKIDMRIFHNDDEKINHKLLYLYVPRDDTKIAIHNENVAINYIPAGPQYWETKKLACQKNAVSKVFVKMKKYVTNYNSKLIECDPDTIQHSIYSEDESDGEEVAITIPYTRK